MSSEWLNRWEQGTTGWHEQDGNTELKRYWPTIGAGPRVLVPLCGKSVDLLWLAEQGHAVTGVELSELAVRAFFTENDLRFTVSPHGKLTRYESKEPSVTIYCGDYFSFDEDGFDALYDRAALIALPPEVRPNYIQHTQARLAPHAAQLLLTLDYEQTRVDGPPYAVPDPEVRTYWPGIELVRAYDDLERGPDKFRQAGLTTLREVVWRREGSE